MVPSQLRRPEYTGENRCWPCTVVNAAVVVVAGVLVGVASPPLGALVLLGGVALIALRGYVVPYTPVFAPRLVESLPGGLDDRFDHPQRADGGRTSESLVGDGEVDGDALVRRLAEAGVVSADESGDLFLADEVRRTWEAGMRRLRDGTDAELGAATASAAPFPAAGRIEGDGDWVVVTRTAGDGVDGDRDGEQNGDRDGEPSEVRDGEADVDLDGEVGDEVWLSRAHAIADTAAVAAVSDRVDALTAARAATPLRLFLETCPLCGGGVEETTVEQCCGGTVGVYDSPETPVLACTDCDELLYEFDS